MDKSKSQSKREAVMGHASPSVEAHDESVPHTHEHTQTRDAGNGIVDVFDTPKKPTHRYFCDACTGIAFYYFEGMLLKPTVPCATCGKPCDTNKKQNFIKL